MNRRMGIVGDSHPLAPTHNYGAVPDEYKDDPDLYFAMQASMEDINNNINSNDFGGWASYTPNLDFDKSDELNNRENQDTPSTGNLSPSNALAENRSTK